MSCDEGTAIPVLDLTAEIRAEGAATVIAVRGEADAYTRPVLVDVLARVIAGAEGTVVLDLSAVTFLDVDGARTIGRAATFLLARDRELRLRAPSPAAIRTLGLFGLLRLSEPMAPGQLMNEPPIPARSSG